MIEDLQKVHTLLASSGVGCPESLVKRREDLMLDLKMCQNDTRLLVRLQVVSKALKYFADQMRWENSNKIRMMAIYERDRLRRLGRKLPDGSCVDTIRPFEALSR